MRGQAFRSLLAALGSLSVDVEAVIAAVPAGVAALLTEDIKGTGWYPVASYAALHQAALEVTGESVAFSRELGRISTRIDARGAFQFVLRFISPESLIRHADRVLGLYIDGPSIAVSVKRPGCGRFHITGAAGYTTAVWEDHFGSMEALVELSGGREPRAVELDRGDDWSVGELTWS